ncbi:hypothetical protein MRX96_036022 [Rhipicephalus microplus]
MSVHPTAERSESLTDLGGDGLQLRRDECFERRLDRFSAQEQSLLGKVELADTDNATTAGVDRALTAPSSLLPDSIGRERFGAGLLFMSASSGSASNGSGTSCGSVMCLHGKLIAVHHSTQSAMSDEEVRSSPTKPRTPALAISAATVNSDVVGLMTGQEATEEVRPLAVASASAAGTG